MPVQQEPVRSVKGFLVGDRVRKVSGYEFPGYIVARFTTRAGKVRYVVEHETSIGMLHIFNEEQLDDA